MAAVTPAQTAPPGLNQFLAALRQQESGGNYREPNGDGAYQILASNWPGWATNAGYPQYANTGGASYAPPAVQDAVARYMVLQYFYGPAMKSWNKVARAWNGGAGCINQPCTNSALGPGDGVGIYAAQVMAKMAKITGGGSAVSGTGGNGNTAGLGIPIPGGSIDIGPSGITINQGSGQVTTPDGQKLPNTGSVYVKRSDTGKVYLEQKTCYMQSPSFSIFPGATLPKFCVDWILFGPLTLLGGLLILAGAGVAGASLGLKNKPAQAAARAVGRFTPGPTGRVLSTAAGGG